VWGGSNRLIDTHLTAQVRLGGGEVRLRLEQRQPRVAEVYRRPQGVGTCTGTGAQFVHRDLQLLTRARDLSLGHTHQLFGRYGVVERLLCQERDLKALVDE